jgi:hypothetical protein
LVQVFSDVVDLNRDEVPRNEHSEIVPYTHGIVSLVDRGEITAFTTLQDHPTRRPVQRGLAWATNRKILETHGFYDALILGSGDRSMAFAAYGHFEDLMRSVYMNEVQKKHYLRWAARFNESVSGRIGYVPGRLYHLWHGDIQNRGYDQRYKMFSNFGFDPENDIKIGPNGAWQWARPRAELANFLAQYFVSRDEDGDGK